MAALGIVTDIVAQEGIPVFHQTELARVVDDGEFTDQEIVLGLIDLSRILLLKLEQAGFPSDDVLADIGVRYRQQRGRPNPEGHWPPSP